MKCLAKFAPIPALLLMMVGCAHGPLAAFLLTPEDRHQINQEATVQILIDEEDGSTSLGTGVVVGEDVVLTNDHVIDALRKRKVDGTIVPKTLQVCTVADEVILTCFKGEMIGTDEHIDLALIRVKGPMPRPVEIGDDETLKPAAPVYAFLSDREFLLPSEARGLFRGRTKPPRVIGPRTVIFDLGANPGGSGGPVFDANDMLVGIVQAVTPTPGRPHAVAVPARTVKRFLSRYMR